MPPLDENGDLDSDFVPFAWYPDPAESACGETSGDDVMSVPCSWRSSEALHSSDLDDAYMPSPTSLVGTLPPPMVRRRLISKRKPLSVEEQKIDPVRRRITRKTPQERTAYVNTGFC